MPYNRRKAISFCLFVLPVFILSEVLFSCAGLKNNEKGFPVFRPGEISLANDLYGSFYYFIPSETNSETRILVLVHGTPKDLSPVDNAYFYTERWFEFARDNNFILLAPSFNQEDFSSRYGDRE